MWYHLQCLPSLLRDGAQKLSSRATSFARRAWDVTSEEIVPWLVAIFIVISLGATLILPILGVILLWKLV